MTDDATTLSAEAERKAEGLAANTKQIGEIAGLIASIADQTNLLALNATIEAARAGEAGRGFAVVAQEVKALATQTGKATEEIDRQVTAIREASIQMVKAVHDITQTIGNITGITTSIAGAIEQQNAATAQISENLERATSGTEQVTQSVSEMPKAAAETGDVAERLDALAHDLATDAGSLQRSVDLLLTKLRRRKNPRPRGRGLSGPFWPGMAASGDLEVLRGGLAAIGYELVLDVLTFVERAQSRALHGRDVDEHVLISGRRPDEPVALGRVEPFDGALLHGRSPDLANSRRHARAA